jgi:hypothetical protein
VQDFFKRTVFRSGTGKSEYDPYTYTMSLAGSYSSPLTNAVVMHEMMHWGQHICYTFGGFQSALMHLRDEDSKHILLRYSRLKDERRFIIPQARFSLPGNVEAFFNAIFDHDEHEWIDENIWLYQNLWRDSFICENLFLRMSEWYEKGYKGISSVHEVLKPERLIPRVLQRITFLARGTLGYKSIEPPSALEITNPTLSNFGPATHSGIKLDTIDIIEGMSVAFEMYLLSLDQLEKAARQRLEDIANTYYERAILIFLEIMGFSVQHDNVVKTALMFLTIAEMSLNPPLPPFGIINKLELDWNKIYPPLRFIELCHIAKRVVGVSEYIPMPHTYSRTWILDWIAHVEALYLSQGGTFSHLIKDEDGYLPREKSEPFLALIAEENPTMREILRLIGVNTISTTEKLREVLYEILPRCTGLELYAMLRHGHILFTNRFGIPSPFIIPNRVERCWRELFLPPLVVFENGNTECWFSEEFRSFLIDYNLYHYPLHDIMLRREPSLYIPDSSLIYEERRERYWRQQRKDFSHIF